MKSGTTARTVMIGTAVLIALLLQVTVLPHFAWDVGSLAVVPDVVLLVVVATALLTDARSGMLTGFFAGLLLDLAPPSDHPAGRWALALLSVGYVVGRLAHDHTSDPGRGARLRRPPWLVTIAAAAGGSFVGISVYALTGLVLGDASIGVGEVLPVALAALVLDLVAALLVVPATWWLLQRVAEDQAGPRVRQGTWART